MSEAPLKDAQSLFDDGNLEGAIAVLEGFIKDNFEHPQGHFLMGRALAALGQFDQAALSFRRTAIAGASDPQWLCRAAQAFYRLGRFRMALSLAQIAMTHSETTEALRLVAQICTEMGRWDQAKSALKRALELDPEDLLAQSLFANLQTNKAQRGRFSREDVESGRSWSVKFAGPEA